jgi:hypothetical protein
MTRTFAALLIALLALACAQQAEPQAALAPAPSPLDVVRYDNASASLADWPAPTEHHLDIDAEKRNKRGRKKFIEELHRAAPDVDWRAIEKGNGLAEQERRRQLVENSSNLLLSSTWTEIGSKNQAGRMHCATLSPNGQTLYGGSALGGLWKANYDGTGWTPLGDNLWGGVWEALALPGENLGDPDLLVIWGSAGIRVSRNQGATWEAPTGLNNANSIRMLSKFATSPPTIAVWSNNAANFTAPALWVSTDYGRTFSIRHQMSTAGDSSAWIPRTGPGAATQMFVAHRGRLYSSTNAGATFTPRALVDANASEHVLCGSEAGAPTLYVALANSGTWSVYRSNDAGVSASFVHNPGDFWKEMTASTIDPNVVIYGGVEAFRSTNGGANFTKLNGWGDYYSNPLQKLHADTMGLFAWPDAASPSGESVFYCMDGGIWRSQASGASPINVSLSGLGVSQYYSTHTSALDPTRVLAGAQDQGYQRGSVQPSTGPGPSTNFNQLISGDYGHLTSSNGSHDLVYSVYPGFVLVQQGETNPQLLYPWVDFPAGSNHLWLPPIVADPLDSASFFFCADRLYRYTRVSGATWSYVQHSSQNFANIGSSYMTALAFAPSDSQRAYAVDSAGRTYWSNNRGVNWSLSSSTSPNEHYFYGNAIAVHPTNPLEAVVGGAGYSTAGVRRTTDGGATWQPLTNGLPSTLVYDLAYTRDSAADIYAAGEAGAYRFDRANGVWVNIMQPATPLTLYWSVECVGDDLIRFGTYGRGIWDYDPTPPAPPPHVATYCTAKVSSTLCLPAISGVGTPSASSGPSFSVDATQIMSAKNGVLFYGLQPHAAPYQGGVLCVKSPVRRTPSQNSGGATSCGGVYSYDFNARIQSGLDPALVSGVRVHCQYWYRDPGDPFTTGLSDALEFDIP